MTPLYKLFPLFIFFLLITSCSRSDDEVTRLAEEVQRLVIKTRQHDAQFYSVKTSDDMLSHGFLTLNNDFVEYEALRDKELEEKFDELTQLKWDLKDQQRRIDTGLITGLHTARQRYQALLDFTVRELLSILEPSEHFDIGSPEFSSAVWDMNPLSEKLLVPTQGYVVGINTGQAGRTDDGTWDKVEVGEYLPLVAAKHGLTLAELYVLNKVRARSDFNQWQRIQSFEPSPYSSQVDLYQPPGTEIRIPLAMPENPGIANDLCDPTGKWTAVAYDGKPFDSIGMVEPNWWEFDVEIESKGTAIQVYTYYASSRMHGRDDGIWSSDLTDRDETVNTPGTALWDHLPSGIVFHDSTHWRTDLYNPDDPDKPAPVELAFDGCNVLRAQGMRTLFSKYTEPDDYEPWPWYQVWYRVPDQIDPDTYPWNTRIVSGTSTDELVYHQDNVEMWEKLNDRYEIPAEPEDTWTVHSKIYWCVNRAGTYLFKEEDCLRGAPAYRVELERPDGTRVNYTILQDYGGVFLGNSKPWHTPTPHEFDARWWLIAPSWWTPNMSYARTDYAPYTFAPLPWN